MCNFKIAFAVEGLIDTFITIHSLDQKEHRRKRNVAVTKTQSIVYPLDLIQIKYYGQIKSRLAEKYCLTTHGTRIMKIGWYQNEEQRQFQKDLKQSFTANQEFALLVNNLLKPINGNFCVNGTKLSPCYNQENELYQKTTTYNTERKRIELVGESPKCLTTQHPNTYELSFQPCMNEDLTQQWKIVLDKEEEEVKTK